MQPTNPTVEVSLTYDEAYYIYRLICDEQTRLKLQGFHETAAYVDALSSKIDSMLVDPTDDSSAAKEDAS